MTQSVTEHVSRRREMMGKYPALKNLFGYNRWSLFLLILLVGCQLTIGCMLNESPIWLIVASSYFIGSSIALAIMVLIHDASHNLVAKTEVGNYLALLVANIGILWPASIIYKNYHLIHHKFIGRTGMDADMPSRKEAELIGHSKGRKILWLIFFPYFYVFSRMASNKAPKLKWDVILSIVLQIIIFDRMRRMGLDHCAIYLALSPILMMTLSPAMGSRNLLEHFVFRDGQETYSYYGPYNFITLNNGYHTEHHDFANIPWNRLPQITRIAPEFYHDRHVHGSYVSVIRTFINNEELSLFNRVARTPPQSAVEEREKSTAA